LAADFRHRFWFSLALTLPMLALSPLLQTQLGLRASVRFPGDGYDLFGLASVVFWYGGWPFLKGLVSELGARRFGTLSLVAVVLCAAYLYSSAVVFGCHGRLSFWELAALIDIMLLGYWTELKATLATTQALEDLGSLLPGGDEQDLATAAQSIVPARSAWAASSTSGKCESR
jgi:Cu2+-exporting ATPase